MVRVKKAASKIRALIYRELQRALANLNMDLSESEIELLLRDTDHDEDGKVSYEEFLGLIKAK